MNTTATCFARLLLLGWLLLLVQRPLSAHPALPTEAGPVSTSAAAADAPAPWSSGQSALAPAFVGQLVLSKVQRAARQAYLDADARNYGAIVSAAAQTDRDTAAALFDFINSQDRYVQGLQMQDLTVLPVGMKLPTPGGNGSIEMGILRASFFTDRAELSVFVRVVLPAPDPNSSVKERELFFGADKVVFSRNGGLLGDFRLVLLGDFILPLGNMTIRFKGGLNRFTAPVVNAQTYATVSCASLAGLGIAAEVLFPRSMLVPIDQTTGAVLSDGQVRGDFRVDAPTFDDLVAGVDLMPFAVTGYEKFGFILRQAELDLSDRRNAPSVRFPSDYFTKPGNDQAGGDINAWRGVYIRQFDILLPAEFKEQTSGQRLRIEATDLLFDRNGASGQISMNAGSLYSVRAGGWRMDLREFALAFEKNKLVGGRFAGNLTLPIAPDNPLRYDALIDKQANYVLSLATVNTLSVKLWRARADLDPTSRVTLDVIDGEFRPQAVLHGRMGIFTTVRGDSTSKQNARIAFDGVVFQGLTLQTQRPFISADYFGYEGDSKLGGFAVTVQRIGVEFAGDTIGLRLGLRVNLMKTDFGGETDFVVVGQLNEQNGLQSWSFRRIKFNSICVKGTINTFTLDGCVTFFDNDQTYGDGFGGRISFSMKDPAPIKGGDIAALFGATNDYRYWFVSGGVTLSKPIPIAGPLAINALYLSAYHNMVVTTTTLTQMPSFLSTSVNSPFARTRYAPSTAIHLGFKAVVGLVAIEENLFRGSAGLEMAFSRTEGLNSIGFYGEGQLMGSFTAVTGSQKMNALMAKYQKVSRDAQPKDDMTKKDVEAKSKAELGNLRDVGGAISGRLAIIYDRPNRTLQGDAEVFVNIGRAPLLIQGVGTGGRAGWLSFRFDPTQWYVYVGTPEPAKRIGLRMGFPGMSVRTTGYFMAGHGIPDIPAPPARVTSLLRNWNAQASTFTRSDTLRDSLRTGKGVVFGADMNLRWEIDLWIPYLRLDALAGFDVMMKSPYQNCRPNPQDWYARGQAYAFLQGEAGVKFFGRRPLISIGAAALLDAGLPDPSWLQGQLALQLKLGRVFNKTVNFDLALNRSRICR